uniref:Mitochondrial import inner membrane translocase subunit n=1 Tax=Sciurus vulgaris TaxID=55149 RepID=A0A8D2ATS2_SCIVU
FWKHTTRTNTPIVPADAAGVTPLVAAGPQKAQFTTQVHHFMERCWDKCVEKPGSRLDSGTENCLSTCVNRFIDTTLAIIRRFAQIVQKRGQEAVPEKMTEAAKDLLLSRLKCRWGNSCQPIVKSVSGCHQLCWC